MRDLLQDLRYALRTLRGSPTFTLVAVLTLALGVGANTAIFSVIDNVLLRPLPYRHPDRLVVVGGELAGMGTQDLTASAPEYRDYRDRTTTLEGLAAAWPIDANLTSSVEPERVRTIAATSNLFSVLGRSPALGRDFVPEDAVGEVGYVVILSYDAWQRLFHGDPAAIGRTIRLDDDPMTVIGVMPRDFEQPGESRTDRVSVWVAVDFRPGNRFDQRAFRPLTLIGRLKRGVSVEASRAEFASISAALRSEYPQFYPEGSGWTARVEPLVNRTMGNVRPALLLLFGAVGLVLLTACANVATLLLARGQARGREFAIRVALGSGAGRLVRQLLTETLVLVTAGGVAGIGVALIALRVMRGLAATALPRANSPSLDGTALGFALLVSLLAGIVFGVGPALRAARFRPLDFLRDGRGSSARRNRARAVLAGAQVAVSLVLVVGAGLLTRSLIHLLEVDPGFAPAHVLAVQTWLPIPNDLAKGRFMTLPSRVGFVERALQTFESNPEVTEAAMTSLIPLRGLAGRPFLIEGDERTQGEALPTAEFRQVSPKYFDVMSIPVLRGRTFTDGDDATSPPVVVVDRQMADRWFHGDAVGRRIRFGGQQSAEIVGVVGDVREEALDVADRPHFYVPYRQAVGLNISFVLKTTGHPEAVAGFARRAVRQVDPDQPVFAISSMDGVIAETLGRERLLVALLGSFAVLGLVLAAVGVYGIVTFGVRQRYGEIGIRMALGATGGSVLRLVLRDGVLVSGIGLAAGVLVALAASNLLAAVVRGVGQRDPVTFLLAAGVTAGVALVAGILPARAATRVHPVEAMRDTGG